MSESETKPDSTPEPKERPEHAVQQSFTGAAGAYTVTACTLNLKDKAGDDRGSVFSVAYTLDGAKAEARPVTFCFNGGPGSSAVWLQFGAYGPKRVDVPDLEYAPPPPNRLVDNPHSLLDVTDLVFIDPVGTGFSRAAGKEEASAFHSVDADAESVAEFIWRWLSRHHRWQSPRFLSGESYGTTRAGAVSLKLAEKGISLNGLVLVSLATQFQTFIGDPGNDLPHAVFLPTFAATAAYHGRVTPNGDRDAWLDEVRDFALNEYMPALLQGANLSDERRQAIATRLAAYTGLPEAELNRRMLRVPEMWFARTLLGPGDKTVGRLDSRYVGRDNQPHGISATSDPSYSAAYPAYMAAVNDFVRRELGWETDDPYELISMDVNQGWKWERKGQLGYTNTTEDLRQAMVQNPHLQVLFANGLYDLATPFMGAEFTASHLSVDTDLAERIELTYYEAGHMMYFHPPSLAQMAADIRGFIARSLSPA